MPYDLRLGPLAFTCPTDALEETLGETLEAVGAALTPADRRPRPLKIPLRIEGDVAEADSLAYGQRLRRQARQLLENPDWLAGGLYLWIRFDTELNGWVRIGGGQVRESDPGLTFGIWELELETPYLVGRPATHRAGRRLDLADRRTGLVPRDTRGLIYSTDFAAQALPASPLILPGDIGNAVANDAAAAGNVAGPLVRGRRLWATAPGADGRVISYSPTEVARRDPIELLENPDFAGGVIAPYAPFTGGAGTVTLTALAAAARDSAFGMRVTRTVAPAQASGFVVSNPVVSADGGAFNWSGWIRGVAGRTMTIHANWTAGGVLQTTSAQFVTTGDWQHVSRLVTIPAGATGSHNFYIWDNALAVGAFFDVDLLRLTVGPTLRDITENDGNVHVDGPGSVRVWDTTAAPAPTYVAVGDFDPAAGYGWERIYGAQIRSPETPLAIENGHIRLVWLPAGELAFEWWDATLGKYRREGTLVHAPAEASVVELTAERAVIEWRTGDTAIRAILQRGWFHARLEAYHDAGGTARLEWKGAAAPVVAAGAPTWVKTLTASGRVVYWATGTLTDANVAPALGGHTAFTRAKVIVAQIGSPSSSAADVAGWSLVDAQSRPVLLSRAS